MRTRAVYYVLLIVVSALCFEVAPASAQPTCPLSYGTTDAAKSHKLFLYFPTSDDSSYPSNFTGESPARHFDVAELDNTIGTTAQLRDRIHDVVVDDFCEFNVQVLATTTNPETMASPPALRHTEGIGSDNNGGGAWGRSPTSNDDVLFGRVWAGAYVSCEGGDGAGGCSTTGSLTGANSTLDRWAQAIGGTAAHESGHTYGLNHTDDDPPAPGYCQEYGPGPSLGEDAFTRHLMPNGCRLDGTARTTYRRHVSDIGYGILATNVGLSVQTMHNWDLVNPNAQAANKLVIVFLSSQTSMNLTWSWTGASSPWINPVVAAAGSGSYHGTTYHKYTITWSAPNPAWGGGPAGTVNGGGQFHVGATFTGVDFNQPDPIIIQNVTLYSGSTALALHPRLPIYDAGSLDSADGSFALTFQRPAGAIMRLGRAVIYQLPRVASIDSMNGDQQPYTFDRMPIRPWTETRCTPRALTENIRCIIAHITDRPHVLSVHKVGEPRVYDCREGIPWDKFREDSKGAPDVDGPICAATVRDPFPSATVYVIATFVDPLAKHWDPMKKRYVTGPVTSKVYYQFSGVRNPKRLGKQGDRTALGR